MRAATIYGERDVRVEEAPEPVISTGRDAVVRVVASCVCGSDLWPYRGVRAIAEPRRMGHEFVGVVDEVGDDVQTVQVGDFVIAPFYVCDGVCVNCRNGFSTSCLAGGAWGAQVRDEGFADGGQGERVRVPYADGTLFVVPGGRPDDALIPGLLTLSDVMCTGHHAAVSGAVRAGSTVAVVGDGAVGLCAIIAAERLGAQRIVAMSRHESRQALARSFGATDIVPERGEEGIAVLKKMFDGIGPDVVLECVGTKESMDQALRSARPGGQVGFVGVPAGGPELPVPVMFGTNVGVRGGVAPVRDYMAELLPEVLDGRIEPGRVFDLTLPLSETAAAYAAMDERRAVKVLLRP
ncbi:zinc-dependent alcohol dehydrogenase family protein [Actinoplanes bogorensis]|uniref:Zinc-dependent alcohol dehydrogenase family protein n=1 Tax=Paractinoplanes bogorensis TaxID=1610840 RepID=A0ABS5YP65_9ACTN|nr:zinc-dependent alcohol dehydrogenase family protein [Actinoplanes bogorensis]MBU2664503.1 zinc-dependent alcohol dehydrogenase family protein [Actinoplanes bogorensis]